MNRLPFLGLAVLGTLLTDGEPVAGQSHVSVASRSGSATAVHGLLPEHHFEYLSDRFPVLRQEASSNVVQMVPPEEEAPESAVSSPPMELDDPATPGSQGIELNLNTTWARAGGRRGTESLLDANYGVGDRIQLKFERPYVTTGQAGQASQKGMGPTNVGVKWRFLEKNGWQLAAYPAYQFDDGLTPTDEKGDPDDSEGASVYLPLLVSKTVGRVSTVAANFGYAHNRDYSTNNYFVGIGLGRAVGPNTRIMSEIVSEEDADFNALETSVRVGVASLLFPGWLGQTGFEFPIYASISHTIGRVEDGEQITTVLFGVTIAKPGKED